MDAPWRIELFGGLRASRGAQEVRRFRLQKAGALLAYLAYFPHRSHPRETLIELLWPESDLDAGRNRLSVALSSLRRQLEPPGVPAGAVLLADHSTLQLNPAAVTTDVAAFQAALQAAARAGSGAEQVLRLTEAAELYRGELLPGCLDEWVLPEREGQAELFLQALSRLAALLEERGELPRAVQWARQAVATDPLREEAHTELIRLLAASGETEAALRQYRELGRLLDEQLGEAPGPETRALVNSLRVPRGSGGPGGPPRSVAEPTLGRAVEASPRAGPVPAESGAERAERALPSGTVTFLLTDIERSTALWGRTGEVFQEALASHHALLRQIFGQHGGHEFKELGDGFLVAFQRTGDALACAMAGQQALIAHPWPAAVGALRVRMSLHTGDVQPQAGDYHGLALHHAQRVLVAGHGGQILCSEATASLLRRDLPADVRLTDLGIYRLRDVATPERLFQVEYPGMEPPAFPPLNAEAGYASHLPLQFTRFFGREAECTRLAELLRAPGTRLVTLTGPGGTGKTRLALAVAERMLETMRGAVSFVPLADLTDPHRLAEAVRDALRLPRSPGADPLEQVVSALSRQQALLLLDNFEQLAAEGAPWVQALLERVPALICLVTSRQRLDLPGEREFPLLPLPLPNGARLPEDLVQCESVQLFVDRAQAARPDFQVTTANAAAVAALCRRLEGIPLALELAAARAQVLTPAQMLARLEQRFELLVSRQRGAAPRQRSLRATLDWSYELLSPELQRFFARLSIFRGGFALEAAEAVGEAPAALDDLAELRQCSLVLAEELDSHEPGGGEMRYRLLETLREYGAEQVIPEERTSLTQRHIAYYLELAERAQGELAGASQAEWLDRLEVEHDNLRAALERAVESGDPGAGLRLGAALWRFWLVRGYLAEGRERLSRLLASAPSEQLRSGSVRAWGDALNGAGVLAYRQGDHRAARAFHERSLAIRRELGDQRGITASLQDLGNVAYEEGDYGAARSLHEESLAISRELGDRQGIASALNNLGRVAHNLGDYEAARLLHEESLSIRRELADQWHVAASLENLGLVAYEQGDYEAARSLYDESLAIRRELGDRQGIADSLNNLGNVTCRQGDYAAAQALYAESLALAREVGDRWSIAALISNLGTAAQYQGDYPRGAALTVESLTLFDELGNREGVAECLKGLAVLAAAKGQFGRAARLFGAAEALREALGTPLPPSDSAEYECHRAAVRAGLGEAAFAAAWAEGRRMTTEQAVKEASGA